MNTVHTIDNFKSIILVKLNIETAHFEAAILDNAPYETTLYNWMLKSYHKGKSIAETVILIQKTQRICALKSFMQKQQ